MALETLTIEDSNSGARAKILPAIGFNCYSFQSAPAGKPLEVLWTAPDFLAGTARPSGSGIPLLFPFAGRIRGTSFRYEGRDYPLEAGDGQGNALHGFVINRPWRITQQTKNRASGLFQASIDDPSLLKRWPADFRITADYRLEGNSLFTDYTIENPDSKPLPFGFGTHGYFRVPLGGGDPAKCVVKVPVEYNWELDKLLPTGRKASSPLTASLTRGIPFGEMKLDHVFSGLKFDNHRCLTTIHDPQSKRTLTQSFDDQFPACVLYNPPHREAVCIEPYTTLPDAFWMKEQGIDPHLQVLAPGASFRTSIEIRLD